MLCSRLGHAACKHPTPPGWPASGCHAAEKNQHYDLLHVTVLTIRIPSNITNRLCNHVMSGISSIISCTMFLGIKRKIGRCRQSRNNSCCFFMCKRLSNVNSQCFKARPVLISVFDINRQHQLAEAVTTYEKQRRNASSKPNDTCKQCM